MVSRSLRKQAKIIRAVRRPTDVIDYLMVALGLIAFVMLLWINITWFGVGPETKRTVIAIDQLICAIFAAEFLWRWHQRGWIWQFPLVNWFDIVGMIPLPLAAFRGFRLLRIGVIFIRFVMDTEKTYGDQFIQDIIGRFAGTIVNIIKRPVTIAVLDEVGEVLKGGNYTQNIAIAFEANQPELQRMAVEVIKNDPRTAAIRVVPFHDQLIELTANTTFRILLAFLADPRTDALVADLIRENIDQIRQSVRDQARISDEESGDVTRKAEEMLAQIVEDSREGAARGWLGLRKLTNPADAASRDPAPAPLTETPADSTDEPPADKPVSAD